jgi:hypothetical protein
VPLHDWKWFKNFVEGGAICDYKTDLHANNTTVFCSDNLINQTIHYCYTQLPTNPRAQVIIDSFLSCCQDHLPKSVPLSAFAMLYDDTPQFETLPDLGDCIRESITACLKRSPKSQKSKTNNYLCKTIQKFLQNFPNKGMSSDTTQSFDFGSVSIMLTLLQATLLGLYPSCKRQTPWNARVAIYHRMHMVMTSSPTIQIQFAKQNKGLINIAVAEYLCRVLPIFMPAETRCMEYRFASSDNIRLICSLFDGFRQDSIDDGRETWLHYESQAQAVVDSCFKGRRKCKYIQGSVRTRPLDIACTDFTETLDSPCLKLLPIHMFDKNQLKMEYEKLSSSTQYQLHRACSVTFLPNTIAKLQLHALAHIRQKCERLVSIKRKHIVCLQCIVQNRCCELRMLHSPQSHTDTIIQNLTCERHGQKNLLEIDIIGKVLHIHGEQYVFTPCCSSVHRYEGNSHEIWNTSCTRANAECTHTNKSNTRQPQKKCYVCDLTTGLSQVSDILDRDTLDLVTLHLCSRHCPHEDYRKLANDSNQLMQMALNYEKNHKKKRFRRI